MSDLRTISMALRICCLACLLAFPAQAGERLGRIFAECTGRFSAEREHAWLLGGDEAEHYQAQYEAFAALLDATVPQAQSRTVLSYRIEAKMAHASLLRVATFHGDRDRARRAKQLAARHVGRCRGLLLGG